MHGRGKLGKCVSSATVVAATLLVASLATGEPWGVTVGNPGNGADTTGYGSVGYTYRISAYEVTAGEYAAFLNDVACDGDPFALYNTNMSSTFGCKIAQTESGGSYTYSVASDYANRPVNYVTWYDAIRFANWKTGGSTESGTYTITGGGANSGAVDIPGHTTLTPGQFFLPTEDEWYKAAYYDPDKPGGAGYYDYATGTDSTPSNDLVEPTDPGNNATFYQSGYTLPGGPPYRTEVGAHENSESPYGTFDQGGNVWEWNETAIGSSRGLRGGSWIDNAGSLTASFRGSSTPAYVSSGDRVGFRLASPSDGVIPEPLSAAFMGSAFAGIVAATMRRRRKRKP